MGCKQSQESKEESSAVGECIICFNPVENILWPCGHFCLCNSCASRLVQHIEGTRVQIMVNRNRVKPLKCPICREFALPTKFYLCAPNM